MSIEAIKARHDALQQQLSELVRDVIGKHKAHLSVADPDDDDKDKTILINSIKQLQQQLKAVGSIRREYANLIAQERGLVGADTVLDMIDAALAMGEK